MSLRRHRIAWTVSLIGHACLIACVFAIVHTLRLKGSHDPDVDTRAGNTDDSPVICLHVDEAESPKLVPPVAKTIQQLQDHHDEVLKHPEPTVPIAPTMEGNSSPAVAKVPSFPGVGKPTIAPLHGKLSREGYTVVYVLDHSGSMGRAGKLNKARELLKASIRQLAPCVRFQIVAYDSDAEAFKLDSGIEPVLATSDNIARAENQLDQLIAEGSSRHVEGLRIGLRFRPNLLILLSDADDLSAVDAGLVKQWNARQQTVIHAVILGSPSSAGGVTALKTVCHRGEAIHFLP